MADYAVGDLQGCFDPFMRLLEKMNFSPIHDRLWLVGDLVNRGAQSLEVLRWVYEHRDSVIVTLGNHDFYFLIRLFAPFIDVHADDTLQRLLEAPDVLELGDWLRKQPLLYHDKALNVVMCHAGLAPMWTVSEAVGYAHEVEAALGRPDFEQFLKDIYGDEPVLWKDTLTGMDRLRCITNYLTRMRFCDAAGGICLSYKGTREKAPPDLIPWFAHPARRLNQETLVVGHWSALGEIQPVPGVYVLDTGCIWGQALTGMRLQDKVLFSEKGSS